MKKKILSICLAACLAVMAITGASLAYFTAEDTADNVFTMKGIKVEINEPDFDTEAENELIPGLDIDKSVYVRNTGSSDAYVRVHIAIPAVLDDGDPSFAAYNNFLHFNFDEASVEAGEWSWIPEMTDGIGYKGNGEGNWNYYPANIDGIEYGVYVVTYRTALEAGKQTKYPAMNKVYVDTTVDCEWDETTNGFVYTDTKGNIVSPSQFADENGNIQIKVFAEAAQIATFTDAYDALNTAFGTPGAANYTAPWNK